MREILQYTQACLEFTNYSLLLSLLTNGYCVWTATARKLDETVKEENLSGQTLGEKLWRFLMWWRQENPGDDAPVSPGQ